MAIKKDNIKLEKIFGSTEEQLKEKLRSEELLRVNEIKNIAEEDSISGQTIQQAKVLEGSLRNTGIHACGVIITPDDITQFVPVATELDANVSDNATKSPNIPVPDKS